MPSIDLPQQLSARARYFLCTENEVLLRRDGTGLGQLPTRDELTHIDLSEAQMVGTLDGEHCLAVPCPKAPALGDFELVGLRSLWARLDELLFAVAGRANHLAHFAQTHRFCGRCGSRMERAARERAFRCPRCELLCFPRISPAIITLVRRGAEALLATSGRFPVPFFSTLAGFSEIGESLEQTLVREVREEVGLRVSPVRYFGSQPWPFPHSLMIAFNADYLEGEIAVDGVEIKEARFFCADALPRVPPRQSIARQLIDAWVREVTGHDAAGP